MYEDDKDYRFRGNYDVYYECEQCYTSCVLQVRYNKKHKEIWHSENNKVKDYIIKYK